MHAVAPDLRYRPWSRRSLVSTALTAASAAAFAIALLPLVSVLASIVRRGAESWQWSMIWELPPTANEGLGGFAGALVGTAVMVGLALLLAAPIGVAAGVWLSEFGRGSRSASVVRFAAKSLAGLPSVLAGAVAYVLVIVTFKSFHPLAGAVALALLMLPTIALQTEQALSMLPSGLREAALAAGATDWQTAWRVTLPTAFPGIMTGMLLAAARGAGETAPLLFTALFSPIVMRDLREPAASLSVQIFNFAGVPYANQQANAWSTALALVVFVLSLNIAGRALARRRS